MKISIAICTYNGEAFLREQLDSFAAQTRLPDEIIVCDDCSKDETRQILSDFAEKSEFPVELHFNEQNLGYIKNFEKAIGLCSGEIIVLSDQDDVWETNKLAVIEREFAKSPDVGFIYADAAIVDENLKLLDKTMWQYLDFSNRKQKKISNGKAFDVFVSKACLYGSSMAFRAKFLDLILPIPADVLYAHDNWIGMMISAVAKCRLVDERLIKYRQHQHQASVGVGRVEPNDISAARRRTNNYDAVIKQLEIAESRLLESSYDPILVKNAVAKIRQAKSHWQNRAALPKTFLHRLPIVARELFQKQYHNHSNGFHSAIKDLL